MLERAPAVFVGVPLSQEAREERDTQVVFSACSHAWPDEAAQGLCSLWAVSEVLGSEVGEWVSGLVTHEWRDKRMCVYACMNKWMNE